MHLENGDGSVLLSGGVEVVRSGGHPHVLLTTQGIRIFWDGVNRVEITVSTAWQGRLCGLCGNYNNNATDDFIGPNGQQFTNVDQFVTSWVVGNTSSCGILAQAPACSGQARTDAIQRCNFLTSMVSFIQCSPTVDPQPFITHCIDNYCICDDADKEDCFCNSLTTLASVCAAAGRILPYYLRLDFCRKLNSDTCRYSMKCIKFLVHS